MGTVFVVVSKLFFHQVPGDLGKSDLEIYHHRVSQILLELVIFSVAKSQIILPPPPIPISYLVSSKCIWIFFKNLFCSYEVMHS